MHAFYGGIPLSLRFIYGALMIRIKESNSASAALSFTIKYPSLTTITSATFFGSASLSSRLCHTKRLIIHNCAVALHNVNRNLSFACNDKSCFIDKNIHLNV